MQSSSLDFKLVQRVCLLQQALDQAVSSLEELRAQVRDKQYVEAQLANTEKFANVQQQAIAHLKQQLGQFTEVQNNLLSVMGHRLNELIEQQQLEFDRLNVQFQQGSTELQAYLKFLGQRGKADDLYHTDPEMHRLALEAEVMIARSMATTLSKHLSLAKQHIENLTADLSNHHLNVEHIIRTIQAMIADLAAFEGTAEGVRLEVPPPSPEAFSGAETRNIDTSALQVSVRRQGLRIHELETILMEQIEHQTQLRQRYQAVAAERDFYKRELEKIRSHVPQLEPTLSEEPSPEPKFIHGRTTGKPSKPFKSHPSQPIQPLKLPEEWDGGSRGAL